MKTHCPQGHPYEGDNLYVGADGYPHCRECRRQARRNHALRKRGQPAPPAQARTPRRWTTPPPFYALRDGTQR